MIYEVKVRHDGQGYYARTPGGCIASATSCASLAVERAARKALGKTARFTIKRKPGDKTIFDGKTWRDIWLVIENAED
ncbi:MAG: hypothetical protein AB1423_14340 [Pseudomonadota bacterium]